MIHSVIRDKQERYRKDGDRTMMKALIFDLDGVLVFTDKYHYQAWKEMADRMGIYFDERINNRLRGVSRRESLEIILEKYTGEELSEEEKEKLMKEKNERYRQLLEQMTHADVSEEVRRTLLELKNRGYRLAVGSSSKNTKFILEKTGLTGMFDAISDGTNISCSKPDPEVFTKAAEFLHEKNEVCYVVEDAKAGIQAAKAAGMKAIGIGEAAEDSEADYSINRFSEILDLV